MIKFLNYDEQYKLSSGNYLTVHKVTSQSFTWYALGLYFFIDFLLRLFYCNNIVNETKHKLLSLLDRHQINLQVSQHYYNFYYFFIYIFL